MKMRQLYLSPFAPDNIIMTILFPHHGSLLCIVSHLGCLLRVHEKHLSTVCRVVIFSLLFLILLETKRQSLCRQKIPSTYQTVWKVTKSVSLKSRMDLRLLKLPIRFMFRGLINYGLWSAPWHPTTTGWDAFCTRAMVVVKCFFKLLCFG